MTPPIAVFDGTCLICDGQLTVRWTDVWGIAACWNCGAPYRMYFNTADGVKTPSSGATPELLIKQEWIPLVRRYRKETERLVEPGAYIFLGDRYEVADDDDFETWSTWMNEHKSEWPEESTE